MQHIYTHRDVTQAAEDAIGLFLEYRDVHGYEEERAKAAALLEVFEGTSPETYRDIEEMRARKEPYLYATDEPGERSDAWNS